MRSLRSKFYILNKYDDFRVNISRSKNTHIQKWIWFLNGWNVNIHCVFDEYIFCFEKYFSFALHLLFLSVTKKTEPNSEIVHWSALKFLIFNCAKNIVNTTLKLERFSITWRMERGMCFFVHNNIRFQFVEDQQLHPKCKYQTHIFFS